MKIGRSVRWYRPYTIIVNNKEYKVEKFHFYKENSILVSTLSGWLETKHGDIESIELPVEEIKLKRKEKFDGTVFAIVHKESYGHDTVAELYIPSDIFNIRFVENKLQSARVYAVYEGDYEIHIESYIKSLDGKLYEIRNEYEVTYKQVSDTCLAVHKSEDVLKGIDKLKELAEKYIAERERVRSLTIDDIDLNE